MASILFATPLMLAACGIGRLSHFLRNAPEYLPRRVDCLQELGWLCDRRDLPEAHRDLAAWLTKWAAKYPKLTGWVEVNIDQTLTFYRLPRQHHKHLKSTNMPKRLNEEIKGQTHVVPIFPNGESCLKLVRALAVKTHENWLEQHRYLNVVTRFRARRNTDPGVFANCPM